MVGQIKIFFISSTKYISNNQQDYYPNSHQTIHVVSNQHNYCSLSWSYGYCVFMLWAGGMLEAKTICFCSFSVVSCFFVLLLLFGRHVVCFCKTCYLLLWFQSSVLWSCNFKPVNLYYVIRAIKIGQLVNILLSIKGYSPKNLCSKYVYWRNYALVFIKEDRQRNRICSVSEEDASKGDFLFIKNSWMNKRCSSHKR